MTRAGLDIEVDERSVIPMCLHGSGGDTGDVQRHRAHRVGAAEASGFVGERSGRHAAVTPRGGFARIVMDPACTDPRVGLPIGRVRQP